MIIFRDIKSMQSWSLEQKRKGYKIGFVPTMGFLHRGHISLIEEAVKLSDYVVVSIYVNPTQFGENEDYAKYPRDEQNDIKKCEVSGAKVVFITTNEIMYPSDYLTYVNVEKISNVLCGKYRPSHFRGVATIVAKLFNIVQPDIAIFGQKDAQQAIIIKQMVKDLNFPVEIVVKPTIREDDGLAMSSRNSYLTHYERQLAPKLYEALKLGEESILNNKVVKGADVVRIIKNFLKNFPDIKIQYVEVVNTSDLSQIKDLEEYNGEILITLACFIGSTRLIDNILIKNFKT